MEDKNLTNFYKIINKYIYFKYLKYLKIISIKILLHYLYF